MDKTIKHFILMRFFSWESRVYLEKHNFFDVDFLTKQLDVATNHALKSLENQTNKNFELIFVLHPNFFDDPKYEFIFTTLKDSTTLPIKFMRNTGKFYLVKSALNPELCSLIKNATSKHDFVITTRMDFDDFVFKDAVEDTQSKINECDSVLSYGYNNGCKYILGELYPFPYLAGKKGHHSVFQSLILKSSFAKNLPCLSVEDFDHDLPKTQLKEFLEKNGVKFSEKMFQQNTSKNAYIYFRSESSHFITVRQSGDITKQFLNLKQPLTDKDTTKKHLEEEFGFSLELNSIK